MSCFLTQHALERLFPSCFCGNVALWVAGDLSRVCTPLLTSCPATATRMNGYRKWMDATKVTLWRTHERRKSRNTALTVRMRIKKRRKSAGRWMSKAVRTRDKRDTWGHQLHKPPLCSVWRTKSGPVLSTYVCVYWSWDVCFNHLWELCVYI